MIDGINGAFLFAASLFYALNVRKLIKDKEVKGYSLGSIIFFTAWNCWNVVFYVIATDLFWTQFSSGIVALLNVAYLCLLIKYRRRYLSPEKVSRRRGSRLLEMD